MRREKIQLLDDEQGSMMVLYSTPEVIENRIR